MRSQVHPAVAVIIILLALVAVWFAYTRVFTGQVEGTIGPPSGASMPPPPTAGAGDMPRRTQKASKPAAGARPKSMPATTGPSGR